MQPGGTAGLVVNSCRVGQVAGAIFILMGFLGLMRSVWGYWIARQTYIAVYDTLIYYVYVVSQVIVHLKNPAANIVSIQGAPAASLARGLRALQEAAGLLKD